MSARHNPVVRPPVGKPREVKNLAWLVRHARDVEALTLDAAGDGGAVLRARLDDGSEYEADFKSLVVALRWLAGRRGLRGKAVRLFGRNTTVGARDFVAEVDEIDPPLPKRAPGMTRAQERAAYARGERDFDRSVNEFDLYVDNTEPLLRERDAIATRLIGAINAETYDEGAAVDSDWLPFVDRASRAYLREIGQIVSGSYASGHAFSQADRRFLAAQLAAWVENEAV